MTKIEDTENLRIKRLITLEEDYIKHKYPLSKLIAMERLACQEAGIEYDKATKNDIGPIMVGTIDSHHWVQITEIKLVA